MLDRIAKAFILLCSSYMLGLFVLRAWEQPRAVPEPPQKHLIRSTPSDTPEPLARQSGEPSTEPASEPAPSPTVVPALSPKPPPKQDGSQRTDESLHDLIDRLAEIRAEPPTDQKPALKDSSPESTVGVQQPETPTTNSPGAPSSEPRHDKRPSYREVLAQRKKERQIVWERAVQLRKIKGKLIDAQGRAAKLRQRSEEWEVQRRQLLAQYEADLRAEVVYVTGIDDQGRFYSYPKKRYTLTEVANLTTQKAKELEETSQEYEKQLAQQKQIADSYQELLAELKSAPAENLP